MNLSIKLMAVLTMSSAIFGCASTPRYHERIPFPVGEYSQFKASGTSTVQGDAVMDKSGRDPSKPVHHFYLLPVTSYSLQAEKIAYEQCRNLEPADPRQEQYVRRLEPISNGSFDAKFEFKNVPAGNYYVIDSVTFAMGGNAIDEGHFVRFKKISVIDHENVIGVEIRSPADFRMGGTFCRSFG